MKTNLIGISGKIGSGKDTVGKILQAFTTEENINGVVGQLGHDMLKDSSIIKPVLNGDLWYGINTYQIKKYADKLKDIVCLLIGCTREQLEDREFKEKELGEEWWYQEYVNKLSGHYEMVPYKQEPPSHVYNDDSKGALVKLTPRKLLQLLGTECGRQIIHPNIWVNSMFADYKENKPLKVDSFDYNHSKCIDCKKPFSGHKRQFICNNCYDTHNWYPNWIITDVRFPNEAQAIKDRGGIVIRVKRPLQKLGKSKLPKLKHTSITQHPSETALDDYEFDHIIENDNNIEELIEKVKQLNLV